jgi:putative membrane protein
MRNGLPLFAALLALAAGAPQGAATAAEAPRGAAPAMLAQAQQQAPQVPQPRAPLSDVDRAFIEQAAQTGAADVRLSQLAVNRAKSARVQDFARTVAEERAEANEQLRELALAKGVPVAAEPTAEQQHVIDAMDELAGSEFDTEYMAHQVRSYEDAIVLHRTQLDQTQDPDLRGFTESSLALLQRHLETAQALADQVRATAN